MRTWAPKAAWSQDEGARRTFDELFEGVVVRDEVRTQALDLIARDGEERRLFVVRMLESNQIDPSGALHEQIAMMRRRDAALRLLLDSDAERARFDVNAARADRLRTGEDPLPPSSCALNGD
jgi:hypothetical protein